MKISVRIFRSNEISALLLNRYELICAHIKVCVLYFVLEQA